MRHEIGGGAGSNACFINSRNMLYMQSYTVLTLQLKQTCVCLQQCIYIYNIFHFIKTLLAIIFAETYVLSQVVFYHLWKLFAGSDCSFYLHHFTSPHGLFQIMPFNQL